LIAVAGKRVFNDGQGMPAGLDVVDFHGLAFQLLVIEEEAPQHGQAVLRHFRGFLVGVELGVLGGHRDDLVVALAGVDHGHQPDDTGMDQSERHHGFLA